MAGASVNAENVEFLPIANLETGYEPYIVIEPSFFSWQKWAVTKDCKDPEAVAALLDVLYSDRYEELSAWGIEGETYEVVDGRRQLMEGIGGAYWEQNAKDRKTPGGSLWSGCVFPTVSLYTMESQFTSRPEHKNEFQKSVVFQDAVYPDAKYCYMAIATDEQNARKAALTTDLSTYSSELVTDFILGRASFDDWDQYIAQMQELGWTSLPEILDSLSMTNSWSFPNRPLRTLTRHAVEADARIGLPVFYKSRIKQKRWYSYGIYPARCRARRCLAAPAR